MSGIIGIRLDGASRVTLVSTDDELPDLGPGRAVDVTIEGKTSLATVVIAAGQLQSIPDRLPIAAVVAPRSTQEVSASAGTSQEDIAYRRRKSDLPSLGDWFNDGITAGHVIRVDLRHPSFDVCDNQDVVTTVHSPSA